MDKLYKYSQIKLRGIPLRFKRYLFDRIEWNDRLIGITGARGTGKTTLMLQRLKTEYGNSQKAMYISLDDFYFTKNRLFDFVEEFYMNGGRILFIDEVHRYNLWSVEIKNIYDLYNNLKIVFSGSSALQLHKSGGDLSRRAAVYHLHELSFREFLTLTDKFIPKVYSLEDIIENHIEIASGIYEKTEIIPLFKEYLHEGVYPFFTDTKGKFYDRLKSTIDVMIENDLPAMEKINYQTVYKLRQLISLLADRVPVKINISELSRLTGISRDILLRLLAALDRANLIKGIKQKGTMAGYLTKPDKLFLNNTALLYALNSGSYNIDGIVRETFFVNQLLESHKIETVKRGDFIVDNKYVFEIGGKGKGFGQIAGIDNSFIAADNMEIGFGNKIPLWLFGFLY